MVAPSVGVKERKEVRYEMRGGRGTRELGSMCCMVGRVEGCSFSRGGMLGSPIFCCSGWNAK